MPGINLGPRTLTGVPDQTGNNTGNWTVSFTPDVFNVDVRFDIWKIVVTGASGSSFTIFIENNQWDNVQIGQSNSWDPTQVLPMLPGQTLYFYYNDPVSDNTPPKVTCWLRTAS